MRYWRRGALQLYYWASQPARYRAAARRAARHEEPVRVLFYHRVADRHLNDWTMDTQTFARQIEWMEKCFDVVSLAEAQRRIASGRNRRPTVCLTFDDGYGDNCESALPLLLRKKLPFTYFVATEHVIRGTPFPHDVEAGVPLRPNTVDELHQLVEAGVEIGSHTRTHADLGRALNSDCLQDEIAGSKDDLERVLGIECRFFAFPFGLQENISSDAFQVAKETGYQGVCSAFGAYNFPGDDAFHLRRIHGDPEMIRLKIWLTVDPRKIDAVRWDPQDALPAAASTV